jgi:hypothetical protein
MEIGIAMIFFLGLLIAGVVIYFVGLGGGAAASGRNTQGGDPSGRGRKRPTHTVVEDDGEHSGRPQG